MIPAGPAAPWSRAQVRLAAACDLAGAVAVAVAAVAAGGPSLSDQVLWLDLAVLGLVLAVLVNGSMLLVGRRAIGQRRRQVVPDVVPAAPVAPAATTGEWRWLPGTTRAHSGACQMIAGKPAVAVTADRVRAEGLQRCEVCG